MSFGMIVVAIGVVFCVLYAYVRLKRPKSLIPKGWAIAMIDGVAQDVAPSNFDISKLKPRSFLKNGESWISGKEVRQRAVEFKGNHGLADGKRLLAEQDKIPPEFRGFYIPLPGTLLCGPDGHLFVPCLDWDGGRWILLFDWFVNVWHDRYRFACSEPASNA